MGMLPACSRRWLCNNALSATLHDYEALLSFAGLPNDNTVVKSRSQSGGRQSDTFVPSTSGSEEEDDLYLLAKSIFDLKVSTRLCFICMCVSHGLILSFVQTQNTCSCI